MTLTSSVTRRALCRSTLLLLSKPSLGSAAPSGSGASKIILDTTNLTSLAMAGRARGIFDAVFAKQNVGVEYTQLLTSSQMLEGLVSSSVDIVELGYVGVATGAAARVPFTVVGAASNGGGDVLLVHKGSALRTVVDLKGKMVATTKGSSGWALLLRALDKVGLTPAAISLISLQPDEAQNAFLSGQVDAWAIWSGSKTDAVNDSNSTILLSAADLGLIPGQIALRNAFLQQNPGLVVTYLRARQQTLQQLTQDTAAVVGAISGARNIPAPRVDAFLKISAPVNAIVSDQAVADLQSTADLLFELGEIHRRVVIRDLIDNHLMEQALASN